MKNPSPENYTRFEKLKPKGIIAGSPGIGKTTLVKNYAKQFNIVDFDSDQYRKDPNWPNNYLDLIEEKAVGESLLLISSYPEVVKELAARGYEVTVVCADESLEQEYREKYKDRGNSQEMVDKFITSAFTSNEEQIKRFEGSKVVFLQTGQHLSDIIDFD